ncbi:MAG: hypothetical protein ABR538_09950 [Candidatus Binatia bacterium]
MEERAPLRARIAMAVLSAVVLLVQITATRLLSATVAYHAAFAVLALVMLALAGSAAAVYRDRSRLRAEGREPSLEAAAGMAIAAGPVVAATGLLYILVGTFSWSPDAFQAAHFAAAAIGFYACFHACGYAVAWLLASWPKDIGRVYFADLLGAALGCLLVVPALSSASPVQLFGVYGVAASLAGYLLAPQRAQRRRAAIVTSAVAVLAVAALAQPSWVRLRSAKSQDQSTVLFEKWNQLARVTVSPEVPGTLQAIELLSRTQTPEEARAQVLRWSAGWGMSEKWKGPAPESMWIELDTDAGTQILRGGGTRPLTEFDSLRWDVTSSAYWLNPGNLERTFVIGGGGGRDFLTALAFGAGRVDVVELNPLVVHAVQETFAEYSGRPYSRPGVHYRLGDARSELSRSGQRYDLIQMSMIDTWAASMTGSLTLSENALYTKEAFHTYLAHLTDDGIYTVSRWYTADRYGETARILSLMGDALRSAGIEDPENHVAVVFNESSSRQSWVATCMMKRSPITGADRTALATLVAERGFGLLWPQMEGVTVHHRMDVAAVVRGDPAAIFDGGLDLSPPTDDRPFFFYLGGSVGGARVPLLFGSILVAILLAGRLLVFAPLGEVEAGLPEGDRVTLANARWEMTYFAAIGASFMGVELGVLQRYIVFLGHPTYALSVVLFALLLSTALGSLLVGLRPSAVRVSYPLLFATLAATMFVVPGLLEAWYGWPLAARVVAAGALIVPLGVCMGTALPSGLSRLSAGGRERLIPWMWAVNGLAGTVASVVGMGVAMEFGYTVLMLASFAGYVLAWSSLGRFAR